MWVCFFSHLPVRAEIQCPQVCLLRSQMVLSDLYVGVAQTGKATLFNQTLLPVHFTWRTEVGQNWIKILNVIHIQLKHFKFSDFLLYFFT